MSRDDCEFVGMLPDAEDDGRMVGLYTAPDGTFVTFPDEDGE